ANLGKFGRTDRLSPHELRDKRSSPVTLAHPDMKKRADVFALSIYGLKVEKVSYRVFSENYSSLKELVATPRRDYISEEKWIVILQNLQDKEVEWRAPWMLSDEILYLCGNFN
ncbi:hypothetical protein Golax_025919, partial [Gossypium laxum]|nr:hypothetical protein [Gossypium laxum]